MALELLALVKRDCPVRAPAASSARSTWPQQSSPEQPAEQAARLGFSRVPEVDAELPLSERLNPAAVPNVLLLDDGAEPDRVEATHATA